MYVSKALREATLGKAKEINDRAIAEKRDLTAAEQSQFDALLGAYHEATGQAVPRNRQQFGQWVDQPVVDGDGVTLTESIGEALGPKGSTRQPAARTLYDAKGRGYRCVAKGESFAGAVRETARMAGDREHAAMIDDGLTLGGMIRASLTGAQTSAERAALSGASGSGGGYTVPSVLSANLVDRFRARMRMMEFGAQTIPLDSDTHTFVKVTGDPTVSWRHEGVTLSESDPSFGALTFRPRSVAVIIKVTLELLQDSLNINAAIERSLSAAFATEMDRVGMFGNGVAEPLGLVNETGINAVTGVGTPADYAKILDAYKLILDDNAPDPTGVIMSNREWRTFAGLEDTTGQPLMRPKAIENLPFGATSAVPTNEGGGGAESTMLMGHFPDYAFGIRADLQIEILRELFRETGHYGFVAMMRVDTAAFHPESFCKLTGVTTG